MEYINLSDTFAFFSHQHWLMQDKSQTETITTDMGKVEAATSAELVCETPPKKAKVSHTTPDKPCMFMRRFRGKTHVEPVLSEGQRIRLAEMMQKVSGMKGNPEKMNFKRTACEKCLWCHAPKHTTAWEYRETGPGKRRPIGRFCYSCVHSCKVLGVCRSHEILKRLPDVLAVVVEASVQHRVRLVSNGLGFCTCSECSDKDAEE